MDEHIPEDRLVQYAIAGRLVAPELSRVEEHLLACPSCQGRLAEIDVMLAALDESAAAGELSPVVPFWQVHQTPDGLVRLWVEAAGHEWAACLQGRQLDCRFTCGSPGLAVEKCTAAFRDLFQDHQCRPTCVSRPAIGRG